jgi:hypothetical protein
MELNGENYWSYTNVPPAPDWNVEDTVYTRLDLVDYYSTPKVYAEISENDPTERAHLYKRYRGLDNHIIEAFLNLDTDEGGINYNENSSFNDDNFLRAGKEYLFLTYGFYPDSIYIWGPFWLAESINPLLSEMNAYMRVSQIDRVFSRYYVPQRNIYSAAPNMLFIDPYSFNQDSLNAPILGRDNSYIYRISNIYKADTNGNPLFDVPKDAVGIFGSRSSVYRKTVLKPIRSWDPDTLNWAR